MHPMDDKTGTLWIGYGEDIVPFDGITEATIIADEVDDFVNPFMYPPEEITCTLRLGKFSRGALDVLTFRRDTKAAMRYIRHMKRVKEKQRRKRMKGLTG